jgi:uncharacterized membrane protein YdbT with pleckstrin-like domain
MSYLRSLLAHGEEVVFETRQHWFIPLAQVLTETILIGLLMAVAVVIPQAGWPIPNQLVYFGTAAIGIIVVFSALGDIMRWRNEQYIITDRRVLQMQGVINKNVLDSSLEKINDVQLYQSWIGRIFNYGDIEILTANEDGVNRMRAIRGPVEFKRMMQEARSRYDGYLDRSPVQAYDNPRDVRALLEQLAALRDRGILSPAEFEAKKRELLSRI